MAENVQNNPQPQELDLTEVVAVRHKKLEELRANGKDPFEITKFNVDAKAEDIINDYAKYEGKTVTIAGRMISRRIMGKASFAHLLDCGTTIQFYCKRDEMGEAEYAEFKKWDLGDVLGIEGEVFTTHTGEVSVKVHKATLLSKSLLPLPEKYHGLKDTDLRYRQRV